MIDEEQVATFQRDGGVVVRGLLSADWIATLRALVPALVAAGYDPTVRMSGTAGDTLQADGMWRDQPDFERFLEQSALSGAAASLLRSSAVRLYEDLFLYRPADAAGRDGWHRDSVYWPLTGSQLVNAWFSLEQVTADTGSIRFVAGSHLDADSVALAPIDMANPNGTRRMVTLETEPGDVVLFHPRAIHAGVGSDTSRPRRTFTIRFMGDDVRWRERKAYFHPWMADAGLRSGDVPEHPDFPVLWADTVSV